MSSIATTYIHDKMNVFLELSKFRITFFVAISVGIGSVMFAGQLTPAILIPVLGVFLLACGSSALNHFQERDTDALMERTKSRPIPAGKISAENALIFALIQITTGSVILAFINETVLLLGLVTLIWYNAIYTPLKKRYAMAVVPGSIIGAIPPVIGWSAMGGSLTDPHILALAMFFFIWQIPHFWLLLLLFGEDYDRAGFPTLTKLFSNIQLRRITFVWIVALGFSSLLIPLFDISASMPGIIGVLLLSIWLVFSSKTILSDSLDRIIYRKAFLSVNIYVLLVVSVLSADKLLF